MGLWIRSQDKTILIKVKEVYISNNSLKNLWLKELYKKETPILKYHIQTNMTTLGTYSTKEKAMKVLDMIEKHINSGGRMFVTDQHKTDFGMSAIYEKKLGVFQMPQDEDVIVDE